MYTDILQHQLIFTNLLGLVAGLLLLQELGLCRLRPVRIRSLPLDSWHPEMGFSCWSTNCGHKRIQKASVDICRLASYLGATLMVKISRRPAGLHRQNETTSRATSLFQFVQSLRFSWKQGIILLGNIFLNHSSHSSVDKANMSDIIWLMVPNVPIFFCMPSGTIVQVTSTFLGDSPQANEPCDFPMLGQRQITLQSADMGWLRMVSCDASGTGELGFNYHMRSGLASGEMDMTSSCPEKLGPWNYSILKMTNYIHWFQLPEYRLVIRTYLKDTSCYLATIFSFNLQRWSRVGYGPRWQVCVEPPGEEFL